MFFERTSDSLCCISAQAYISPVIKVLSNISNTRKSVSSDIQTLRRGLKKRGAAEFF